MKGWMGEIMSGLQKWNCNFNAKMSSWNYIAQEGYSVTVERENTKRSLQTYKYRHMQSYYVCTVLRECPRESWSGPPHIHTPQILPPLQRCWLGRGNTPAAGRTSCRIQGDMLEKHTKKYSTSDMSIKFDLIIPASLILTRDIPFKASF